MVVSAASAAVWCGVCVSLAGGGSQVTVLWVGSSSAREGEKEDKDDTHASNCGARIFTSYTHTCMGLQGGGLKPAGFVAARTTAARPPLRHVSSTVRPWEGDPLNCGGQIHVYTTSALANETALDKNGWVSGLRSETFLKCIRPKGKKVANII